MMNAAGTEGFLLIYPDIDSLVDTGEIKFGKKIMKATRDIVVFRVYDKDDKSKFKDYDIHHHDLKVKLLSGVFVEKDGKSFIDYKE
jgi:hypothetical protein